MSLADDRAICEAAMRDLSHEPQAKFDQRFTPWHVSKLLDAVEALEKVERMAGAAGTGEVRAQRIAETARRALLPLREAVDE